MKFDLLSFALGVLFTLIATLIFWGEVLERLGCFK
jgi:hypothetical protein